MTRTGYPVIRNNWSAGIVSDEPRHLIPDNALWDAVDVFLSQDGKPSKRGGTTTAQSAPTTSVTSQLGILRSRGVDGISRGYMIGQDPRAFVPSTGLLALTGGGGNFSPVTAPGNPFQYGNFLVVPSSTPSSPGLFYYGGASGSKVGFNGAGAVTVTAGSPTATGASAPDIAAMEAGMLVFLQSSPSYIGRITSVGASTFTVEPTPTTTIAGIFPVYTNDLYTLVTSSDYTGLITSADCGCAFQNRILVGGLVRARNAGATESEYLPTDVAWSILPTELPSGGDMTGITPLGLSGFETNDFVRIPELGRVIALVPLQDQSLLILGKDSSTLLTGELVTLTGQAALNTFSTRTIQQRVGCLSQRSVQQTPVGVVFASVDGIMLFDGTRMLNLTVGRVQNYWASIVQGLTIYGSATLYPGHYFLSTSAGGLLCNLDGYRWTKTTGVDINASAFDAGGQLVFGLKANQTGVSQSDKLMHLDGILNPAATNMSDATGTAVIPVLKTKTDSTFVYGRGRFRYIDDETLLKRYKHATLACELSGGVGSATFTATPGLEAEATSTLAATFVPSSTPQVARAAFTQPQIINRALGWTITTTGACASFDLHAIETDVADLARRRTGTV